MKPQLSKFANTALALVILAVFLSQATAAEAPQKNTETSSDKKSEEKTEEKKAGLPAQYEIYNTYFVEDYSFTDNVTLGTLYSLVYKNPNSLTLFFENTHQKKFGVYETLFRFGGAYQVLPKLTVQQVLGNSAGKNTFPKFLTSTELNYALWKQLAVDAGYDFYNFDDAKVNTFSEGISVFPTKFLYGRAKFYHALTSMTGTSEVPVKTSFLAKVGVFITHYNEIAFTYANNTESFLSADQIGNFSANSYALTWNLHLTKNVSLLSALSYQDRKRPVQGYQRRMEFGVNIRW